MINWLDAASVIENIGVEREEAEKIAAGVEQLARDFRSFNPRLPAFEDHFSRFVDWPLSTLGLSVNHRNAYRSYARHAWQQTRKPRSVYRGGRWRQMSELTRVKAAMWALRCVE